MVDAFGNLKYHKVGSCILNHVKILAKSIELRDERYDLELDDRQVCWIIYLKSRIMTKEYWHELVGAGLEPLKPIKIIYKDATEVSCIVYGLLIDIPDQKAYGTDETIPGQKPNFSVITENDPTPRKIFLSDVNDIIIED